LNELQELLGQLRQRGLHGQISNGPPAQIIGGRSASMSKGLPEEIPIYRNSFSISRGPDGWLVSTDGEGQLVNEAIVATTDEVLQVIAGVGGVRG
jgi:predicted NAD/FAD-binding protein